MPKKKAASPVTCSVDESSVPIGRNVTISASGLPPYVTASVRVYPPTGTAEGADVSALAMDVDENGNGARLYTTVFLGTNTVKINDQECCTFEVVE